VKNQIVCARALVVVWSVVALGQSAPQVPAGNSPSGDSSLSAADSQGTDAVPLGRPIQWEAPKYPKHALKNRIEGDVALSLNVDPKGKVKNVSVVSGNPELAESAAKAARKWRYSPYIREGRSVAATTSVTLHFKLAEDGHPDITATYRVPEAFAGPVFRVRGGVTPPKATFMPSPEFTEKARRAQYEGTCLLTLIVDPEGNPRDIRVVQSLSMGLDEKAVEAVQRWKFRPATKDGKPVAVLIDVQVQFRLYR
jgi:TonB family protein